MEGQEKSDQENKSTMASLKNQIVKTLASYGELKRKKEMHMFPMYQQYIKTCTWKQKCQTYFVKSKYLMILSLQIGSAQYKL